MIFERYTVLNEIMDISIPESFKKINFFDDENCVLWKTNSNESILLCQLKSNKYAERELLEMVRTQFVAKEQELKNIGVYSCLKDDIKKYMSEDEFVDNETNMYVISCVFRYNDMSFVIYYVGEICIKLLKKEDMFYIFDSIRFNIKE